MARIAGDVFGAMLPKVSTELLPESNAQLAQNLKMTSGALEAWRLPAAVGGVTLTGAPVIKTIYRFGKDTSSKTNYWFQFTDDVNIVKGAINTDTEERTYWTDGTYPKKTKSSLAGLTAGTGINPTSLRMGVPAPTYTPVASVSGTATDPASTPFTSVYVVNFLTSWGEPSAPSAPSNLVTWRVGQTVTLTLPAAPPTGSYSVPTVEVYRSNTGTSGTSYQYLKALAVATASTTDTALAASLGEVCPSFDWTPPSDAMIGLTDMGNGMLAGYKANTISFCEPYYPHAWPAKYDLNVSAPITGMAHFGQTLVVGTTDGVRLFTGVDPSAMSEETTSWKQACVSKRSTAQMLGGVVYACPDGLAYIGPSGPQLISEAILSRDEWQAYVPSSISGYSIDNRYYAFYDNGTTQASLIFTFGIDPGMVKCDQYVTAAYCEERIDSLFVVKTNVLYEWNAGSAMTVDWWSKDYRFHGGVCMSRAMVAAAAYPVTFKLYGGGVLKHTQTVADGLPFVLPAGRDNLLSYRIQSTNKVTAVRIATSAREIAA